MSERKANIFSSPITRCLAKTLTAKERLGQEKHVAREPSKMKTQRLGETISMDCHTDAWMENKKVWAEGLCSKAVPPGSSWPLGEGLRISSGMRIWRSTFRKVGQRILFLVRIRGKRQERTRLRPSVYDILSFLQINPDETLLPSQGRLDSSLLQVSGWYGCFQNTFLLQRLHWKETPPPPLSRVTFFLLSAILVSHKEVLLSLVDHHLHCHLSFSWTTVAPWNLPHPTCSNQTDVLRVAKRMCAPQIWKTLLQRIHWMLRWLSECLTITGEQKISPASFYNWESQGKTNEQQSS